jgi:hypothetical protein
MGASVEMCEHVGGTQVLGIHHIPLYRSDYVITDCYHPLVDSDLNHSEAQ